MSRLAGVRIPFVVNSGQTDAAVAYYAPTFAGTIFVTRDGEIVYSLPERDQRSGSRRTGPPPHRLSTTGGWSMTETPVGGTTVPRQVIGETRAQTRVSYFVGNERSRWRSGLATYESVSLGEVWPGVTLALRAHGRSVEKLFTVRPGADPSTIRMRVRGTRALAANEAGALVVSTGPGEVTFTPPVAFQERDGVRRNVEVAYEVHGLEYGFRLKGHDPSLAVVIDPLLQATYLGGSSSDYGEAIAIHPTSGEVYVVGETRSTDFPGTIGGVQPGYGGSPFDVLVARLTADLTTLIQATYLDGGGNEAASALAIHPSSGDVYVAGTTESADFPGTTGGAQPTFGGSGDVFVARLTADLTALTQATYLGGTSWEWDASLAIHPTSGDVYVAGTTTSSNFPGTADGVQPSYRGGYDTFVARLTADLTTLTQATYLGGSYDDSARALAIHPITGDAYVAGDTRSPNFPGTAGGAQPANSSRLLLGSDAFVARLTADLRTLAQATYLGGSNQELTSAVAIHPISGDVYVAGNTASTDFPGTTGAAQPAPSADSDAFVALLTFDLKTLTRATYLGGSAWDNATGLAIHPTSGDLYVAGDTSSVDFPRTSVAVQPAFGGGYWDVFVARLRADLTTLRLATYLGGSSPEWGATLSIHPASGDVYVVGFTGSDDFPGTTGGAQAAAGGGGDAFVARLTADLAGADLVGVLPKLTVTKVVVNTGGGTKTVGDFPLFVDGAPVSSDVQITSTAGRHTVSEASDPDYTAVFGGDCRYGEVWLLSGDVQACTITNVFKAPRLTVTKVVINSGSGTKAVVDFPLFVDGEQVISGVEITTSVGLHTVSETGDATYTALVGGDCAPDGTITLAVGDVKACTIINYDPESTHDLAVVTMTAPASVLQGAGPMAVSVTIQNRRAWSEVITPAHLGDGVTTGLVRLEVVAVDDDSESCQPAVVALDTAWNATLFRNGSKILTSRAMATVHFLVTYNCPSAVRLGAKDSTPGDYSHVATVFASELGGLDAHPADDVCPRDPVPDSINGIVDRGCGVRAQDWTFTPVMTNVVGP